MARSSYLMGAVSLLLTICLSGTPPAFAEGEVIDLAEALRRSIENSSDLVALRKERGISEGAKLRAGAYPNPVLELETTRGELTGNSAENQISIGISQEILIPGKRRYKTAAAERELEAYDLRLADRERLVAEGTKTAFHEHLVAQRRYGLAENSYNFSNKLLEIAKQRLEAGDIPELEADLARVEVARAAAKKIAAEHEVATTKIRLLFLMGINDAGDRSFVGDLEVAPEVGSFEELKGAALARRPDLQALEKEMAKGDAELAVARSERIPNVTAGIAFSRENSSVEVGGSEVKDADNLISLRLSMPLPLFDRNRGGIRQAVAAKEGAAVRYQGARLAAEREIEAAYAKVTVAERSVALYKNEIIPQLEQNLELVREAYRLGELGILAVIEEQRKFAETNEAYLTLLAERQQALARLQSAAGADMPLNRR